MRYITLALISSMILLTPVKAVSTTDTVPFYLVSAATAFNLDVGLLYAVCRVESHCKSSAINKDDATKAGKAAGKVVHSHGLFQIQTGTAKALGFKGSKKDLMKPDVNSYYAAKYIRYLTDKYKDPIKVISAYNAGHPITGNKRYVHRVLIEYIRFQMENKPLYVGKVE